MRANLVFRWLFEAAFGSTLLIAAMLLLRRFLRRAVDQRVVYALWLTVAVRLLLPITLTNPLLPILTDFGMNPIEYAEAAVLDAFHAASSSIAQSVAAQPYERITDVNMAVFDAMEPINSGNFWFTGWLIGASITLLLMVVFNVRDRRKALRSKRLPSDVQTECLSRLCEQFHRKVPRAFGCDASSRVLYGLHPTLLLSTDADESALAHLLGHLRRGELWGGVLRSVCCVLFWFNPLVWLSARLSRADAEAACDRRSFALLTNEQRNAYASSLLRMPCCTASPVIGALGSGVKQRASFLLMRVRVFRTLGKRAASVLIACLMVALTALTFATRSPASSVSAASARMAADARLAKDVATYFPDGSYDELPRMAADAYDAFLCSWTEESGLDVRCATAVSTDTLKGYTYIESSGAFRYRAWDETAANQHYATFSGIYSVDGTLLALTRRPAVTLLEQWEWKRSAGETVSALETYVRYDEVMNEYLAWAEENRDDFSASILAAKALADQIGYPDAEVVRYAYQTVFDWVTPMATQQITLRCGDASIMFLVELGTARVVAVSFTQDFAIGLTADADWYGSISVTDAVSGQLTADPAAILNCASSAARHYFRYSPSRQSEITCGETVWGYDSETWWEVTYTEPDSNLRYRICINDDGSLRRICRVYCNEDFSDDNNLDLFDLIAKDLSRYQLSEKTLLWLEGGLSASQTLPPEYEAAQSAVNAYIERMKLPFSPTDGYLSADGNRVLFCRNAQYLSERESDVGFLFLYPKQGCNYGYQLFYSILQNEVSMINFFGEDDTVG